MLKYKIEALKGENSETYYTKEYKIRNEIDELDIIYKVDLVFINNNTKKELLESIKAEGVDF